MTRRRSSLFLLLFASASFASAFLIFVVQPLVGKRILPWFGGVPAVWMLCLAFYQVALFAGYAWAHALVRLVRPRLQLVLHALVFAGALVALPVLPDDSWKPHGAVDPSGAILAMLLANVAPPFLVLAATGPLLQAWFARTLPGRSPYPLYAVSNLGSLLALVGYPFLIESRLPVSVSGRAWSVAFVVTGLSVLACAALARRGEPPIEVAVETEPRPQATASVVALWLLLPACAVMLLMGVTNALCLDVASVPFLWILPLAVYLASFILCFRSERSPSRAPLVWCTVLVLAAQYVLRVAGSGSGVAAVLAESIQLQAALFCLFLFGACMVLHGELHRLRPLPRDLTRFYLCLAGGGALGGLFVGLLSPRIFNDYYELQIGVALGALLFLAACWHDPQGWLQRRGPRWRWVVTSVVAALFLSDFLIGVTTRPPELVYQERGFFGVLRVREVGEGATQQRQLLNGSTMHGVQFTQRGLALHPTAYFGVLTGIGLALTSRPPGVTTNIGIVGLGIGTLAAYGRPGDRIRFYEIDPAVVRLAQDERYFSFLAHSRARVEIIPGDARISLEAEAERDARDPFDLLVLDAFTSDSIPVHLLTREAFENYLGSLRPDGLIAVHVSNRNFDLEPILARVGREVGLQTLAITVETYARLLSGGSTWVFLSRDPDRLEALAQFANARRRELGLGPNAIVLRKPAPEIVSRAPLWTDDYVDLLGALRPLPVLVAGRPVR